MKRLAVLTLFLAFVSAGTAVLAHGNNDHVRGVVTQISAASVTVQVSDQDDEDLDAQRQDDLRKRAVKRRTRATSRSAIAW